MESPLEFDAQFLTRLEQLRIASPKLQQGGYGDHRRAPLTGIGTEFADHKAYSPGDDFRYIDWNVYARLDQLALKTFESDESFHVYVLLDTSQSMMQVKSKAAHARDLAAGLAYVALASRDRLTLHTFADDIQDEFSSTRGPGQFSRLIEFFAGLKWGGSTSYDTALGSFCRGVSEKGIVFLISDFWASDIGKGLSFVHYAGLSLVGLQVLDPLEEDPQVLLQPFPDVSLVDSESHSSLSIAVTPQALSLYREEFRVLQEETQQAFGAIGARFQKLSTAEPVEEIILNRLHREGILEPAALR
jgi:uncharacterized protein (DUF58 family)